MKPKTHLASSPRANGAWSPEETSQPGRGGHGRGKGLSPQTGCTWGATGSGTRQRWMIAEGTTVDGWEQRSADQSRGRQGVGKTPREPSRELGWQVLSDRGLHFPLSPGERDTGHRRAGYPAQNQRDPRGPEPALPAPFPTGLSRLSHRPLSSSAAWLGPRTLERAGEMISRLHSVPCFLRGFILGDLLWSPVTARPAGSVWRTSSDRADEFPARLLTALCARCKSGKGDDTTAASQSSRRREGPRTRRAPDPACAGLRFGSVGRDVGAAAPARRVGARRARRSDARFRRLGVPVRA